MGAAKKLELVASVDKGAMAAHLKEIDKEIDHIQRLIAKMPERVQDDADYVAAGQQLISVVVKRKIYEEEKSRIMAKINELIAVVEENYAPKLEKIGTVEEWFRRALVDYALSLDAHAHSLRIAGTKLPERQANKAMDLFTQANACVPPKVPGIAITSKTKVEILDEKKLPEWAWKRIVDTKAIESKIAGGEVVPGAKGVVDMSVRVTPSHAKKGGEP